ncbi:MAG: ABC transporter substrate-binding protein [Armatimonadota bacterium]|nr:ABC transporter substrate-binding protein [Armatimonadota bacterium]
MRRMRCFLATAVAASVVLTGCARREQAPPAPVEIPEAVEEAQQPVAARFTYSEKTSNAPVVVAVERGLYAEEGLKIEKQVVTGGIESAEAIVSGQADVAALGDAPAIICMSRSPKVLLLARLGDGERRHRIVVRRGAGIKRPADLAGKRLAVQHGSSTHGGLLLYLQEHKVDPASITLVSLSPRDFPEAMSAGQIDAAAGSAPWPQNVLAACDNAEPFANLEGLDNTYPVLLLAREEFATEQPEAARAVVRATQAAAEWIDEHPQETADLISVRSGVAPAREREMLKDYNFGTDLTRSVIDSLEMTAQFLKDQGRIDEVPDIDSQLALPDLLTEEEPS